MFGPGCLNKLADVSQHPDSVVYEHPLSTSTSTSTSVLGASVTDGLRRRLCHHSPTSANRMIHILAR